MLADIKARRALACSLLFFACGTHASAEPDIAALRALGARIKVQLDHAIGGQPPAPQTLRDLQVQLRQFHDPQLAYDDAAAGKLRALDILFGELRRLGAGPQSMVPAAAASRAQVDVEVVSPEHGGSCAQALGLSQALPVRVTVGATGTAGSTVWFRYEGGADEAVRFATDSSDGDPALAVYADCGSDAPVLGANDDSIGLDASITLPTHSHRPLFVRLGNFGRGASVTISAATSTISISGKVTDAVSGLPIVNAGVSLVTSYGYFDASGQTDVLGNYTLQPNSAGTYFVYVGAQQHVSQLYPAAPCAFSYYFDFSKCSLDDAQALVVADGDSLSGINVALGRGQKISGVVKSNAGAPIYGTVYLYASDGSILGQSSSDENGAYAFVTLPPFDYRLVAKSGAYGSQMFDHVPCTDPLQATCDLTLSTPVAVGDADVTGVDFDLQVLSTIKGTVTGFDSQPMASATVHVVDQFGNPVTYGQSDVFGRFSVGPLGVGDYYVYASNTNYFSQIFDGIDCATNCQASIPAAKTVSITKLGQAASVSFNLHNLPAVHGHVYDQVTGNPLANVQIYVSQSPPSQFFTVSATTDSYGSYVLNAFESGKYYLWAQSNDHVDQLYSGISCENYSYYYTQNYNCSIVGATLLTIAPGSPPPDFDFTLTRSASISGKATIRGATATNLPANVTVSLYNGFGTALANTVADASGHYVINDLGPGVYFASVAGNYGSNYIPQVWNGQDCEGQCLPTTGTPIVVGAGEAIAGVDFSLVRKDAIVGRVTNSDGQPLPTSYVDVFSAATGNYVASGVADNDGYFAAPAGTGGYFLATDAVPGYYNQVHSGIKCPIGPAYLGECSLAGATAVNLTGSNVQPIVVNFVLYSSDPIFSNGFEEP